MRAPRSILVKNSASFNKTSLGCYNRNAKCIPAVDFPGADVPSVLGAASVGVGIVSSAAGGATTCGLGAGDGAVAPGTDEESVAPDENCMPP